MPAHFTRRAVTGMVAALAAMPGGGARADDATPDVTADGADWQARAPMPWVAQEIYCAVLGDRVVVAGGLAGGQSDRRTVQDGCAIYDPAADTWAIGPRLPEARHHLMLVAAGGRVHALGGFAFADGGEWAARTEVWTLRDDGWQAGAPLPGPQSECVGLGVGNRIHLIGGRAPQGRNRDWTDHGDIADHRVFDDGWTNAAPLPESLNSSAGAVIDGALYVVGGRTRALVNSDRLYRYDLQADRWDRLSPMPPSRQGMAGQGGLAAAALHGRLHAFGGEYFHGTGGGVFADHHVYDPATDSWQSGPPMRTPRHGHAGCAWGGRILAIGGSAVVSTGATTGLTESLSAPH